ncbi:hypothetical protein [Nitrosomonas communis]|uniref:Uncharacterized protein n=1 Tax=Nitrosomonas communis TaxID=44574 RepID=A0A1I4RJL6_9PROT|nr:hypothetical protein [Nitrosomonas communis]SFM52492.1 hypothetical protein SAMN05421863_103331 [Nitrosomonas communis]
MDNQIEIGKFVSLRKQELGSRNDELIQRLWISSQSIHRWLQYCQYHYFNLVNSTESVDLALDRISQYRRKGENVTVRYVYEANIVAFLNSLHALLDSFPYLLNLFIPVFQNPDSTSIKWSESFVKKYDGYSFYDELSDFMLDPTFNKVKGYVNTTKHKYLIRIANNYKNLEFEEYQFKRPVRDQNGKISFQEELLPRQDAIAFVAECHNSLIPRFFHLCGSVLASKGN